jgi:hypothetical protein
MPAPEDASKKPAVQTAGFFHPAARFGRRPAGRRNGRITSGMLAENRRPHPAVAIAPQFRPDHILPMYTIDRGSKMEFYAAYSITTHAHCLPPKHRQAAAE